MYNPDLGPDPQHWHKKSRKTLNTSHSRQVGQSWQSEETSHIMLPPGGQRSSRTKCLQKAKRKRDREREGGWLLAIFRGYHWPPSHTHAHASSHKVRQYQADKRGINKRRQPPKEKKKAGVETIC